jgi:acetyl esterase/lipase
VRPLTAVGFPPQVLLPLLAAAGIAVAVLVVGSDISVGAPAPIHAAPAQHVSPASVLPARASVPTAPGAIASALTASALSGSGLVAAAKSAQPVAVVPSPFARTPVPRARAGAITPVRGERAVLRQNVAFGPVSQDTSIDVYWPASRELARGGGVLLIHGGGWVFGDKDSETATAVQLAGLGYVAASVDYRTYPRYAAWPAAAVDTFTALDVLRSRAADYALDRNHIVAAGWSAGGQLAMLLGSSGSGRSRVSAVLSWSGPSDLTQLVTQDAIRFDCPPLSTACSDRDNLATSFATTVMGCAPASCPGRYADASARRQVSADDVPMLLIASTNELVATSQSTRMATALRGVGLEAQTLVVPGSRHGIALRPVTQSAMLGWLAQYATSPGRAG